MRLKIIIFLLLALNSCFAQTIVRANVSLGTITDLRAQIAQVNEQIQVLGTSSAGDGNGAIYLWNSVSTANDDGFITIAVNGVPTGRWVRIVDNTYQPETLNYLSRVVGSGGHVDGSTLALIDKFITRGKYSGWYQLGKELWIPVGDYNASKVKIISSNAWSFNSFSTADYTQNTGYYLQTNTAKYIGTGFVPNNNALTSQNISFSIVTTNEVPPTNFGRLVGTATVADGIPFYSSGENKISIGQTSAIVQNNFGMECTAIVTSSNNLLCSNYINGINTCNLTNTTLTALPDSINIFRSDRSNGMQYATGSIGLYWIGSYLTPTQAIDLNQAEMQLMQELREVWKKVVMIDFGDSITAGTGSSNGFQKYSKLLARQLGLRLQTNSQGASRLNDTYTNTDGYVSAFNRYSNLQTQRSGLLFMLFGTNDIGQDPATNGTSASANTFGNKYTTIVNGLTSANHNIVLGLIPYRSTAIANATKIALYNTQIIALAKTATLKLVDFYDAFLDTGAPDSYLADGTHPNNAGHLLMAQIAYATIQGRPYRDVLIPSTSVPANSSITQTVTMYGAKNNVIFLVGTPTVVTSGISYSVAWTSNDTYTITIMNSTGSPITTTQCNLRIQIFIDYVS